MSVVGNPDATRIAQGADLGHSFSLRTNRHRTDRIDPGKTGLRRLAHDFLGHADVVVDRIGVGHAGRRHEAARHRRGGARGDGLLVFLPGLAEVDVHVDEPGTDDELGRHVHPRRTVEGQLRPDRGDPVSLDADVDHPVDPLRRVDDLPALEHHRLRCHSAPSCASKPPSR